jgi:hypothetical protein
MLEFKKGFSNVEYTVTQVGLWHAPQFPLEKGGAYLALPQL